MISDLQKYITIIRDHLHSDYKGMLREAGGALPYPFITPGSDAYADVLWDWDCWLSNVALHQVVTELNDPEEIERISEYERGCVLNFLHWLGPGGWIPIEIGRQFSLQDTMPDDIYSENMHKPVLAQHAAFLTKLADGDAEWLREKFQYLHAFLNNYRNHHRHKCGLYFWQNDGRIGVDNDPCTYYRPPRSSGSIFLNCIMYKELEAAAYLCDCLNLDEVAEHYRQDALDLKCAIQENCWDERDGFFYSVDLNLLPVDEASWLHSGQPRNWDCLIQRIGVWSGFLAMWAEIASDQQASRIISEHYLNPKTFNAKFGVRTLSKMEKMYNVCASGNPSCWLGPVWGVSNYLTYRGLIKYGFDEEARELVQKTIILFGRDFERFGALHEYYQPENGEPILNRGFLNWNALVLNMIAWFEGREVESEY